MSIPHGSIRPVSFRSGIQARAYSHRTRRGLAHAMLFTYAESVFDGNFGQCRGDGGPLAQMWLSLKAVKSPDLTEIVLAPECGLIFETTLS